MTIGIDIRPLGSGRRSGVEEYIIRLLENLIPLDPTVNYKLFYSSYSRPLPDFPWLRAPNVSVFRFKIPNRLLFFGQRFLGIPKIDKLLGGVDVFFSPHFLPVALSPGVKRVTTFHDLSFLRFPEFFPSSSRWWHRFINPIKAAKFSDRLIAVSDSTARDLEHFYSIDPVRVTKIYSGVGSDMARPEQHEISRFKYDKVLPDKFILFLGTLEPRKNIIGLIRAFEMISRRETHLIIAGSPGWLYEDILKSVENSPAKDRIRLFGTIQEHERPLLYGSASVFAYPSFFEGFGFPPLEAMACGVPVIVSQNSSLPEVVGNSGILVNPYSISSISTALEQVLGDQSLAVDLSTSGQARAELFTWEKTAKETLRVLTF
ncbi:MAG: glycosyltransferase family 1 protein [Patescibacteria group bacterium]